MPADAQLRPARAAVGVGRHAGRAACRLARAATVVLAVVCALAASRAEPGIAGEQATALLQPRVAGSIDAQAGIEDVCCGAAAVGFTVDTRRRVATGPATVPLWLRFDAPLAGSTLVIAPVVDRATLYWRDRATGRWGRSLTGDHLRPHERTLPVNEMALPIPASADAGPVYLRIEQPSFAVLRFTRHDPAVHGRLVAGQREFNVLLLGFVSALFAYNLVVSALIRDRVFLFNALTILSMAVISAYLTGYGSLHVWSRHAALGDQIMNLAMAAANLCGLGLIGGYLARGDPSPASTKTLRVPVPLVILAWLSGVVGPYHVGRHALLLVSALTLTTIAVVLLREALRGDRNARLIGVPFLLAMLPGVASAALPRITEVDVPLLPDNALGIFLALEALLFSLVLASRVRSAESAREAADAALQAARRQAGARILRAQDAERRRVAQDLHDSVGQRLLLLINTLRASRTAALGQGFAGHAALGRALDDAGHVLDSLRRISRNMHPAMLDHLGWQGAVESLVEGMNLNTAVACSAEFDFADAPPDGETGLHLYRIVQEGFNNVLRHAGASRCVARFERSGNRILMTIDDDGVGCRDAHGRHLSAGLGLTSIDERTRILAGEWRIGPGPLGGARLEVAIPDTTRMSVGRHRTEPAGLT